MARLLAGCPGHGRIGTVLRLEWSMFVSLFSRSGLAACLLAVSGACLSSRNAVAQDEFTLSEFNNTGFLYTFDDFVETRSSSSVRLTDSINGWGGGGIVPSQTWDLTPFADGRVVVDVAPEQFNQASSFQVELIDTVGRTGNWTFNVSNLGVGEEATLVATTDLNNPQFGLGDFQNLDLANIERWQVLGNFNSPALFDMSFGNVKISNTVDEPPPYAGAEPDAAWRAVADARIDANRKADLTVSIVDAAGAAVPGATVAADMQEHEFGFGSAVQAFRLRNNAGQHQQYKDKTDELFNIATVENNYKWPAWEGEWGGNFTQGGAAAATDWLLDHDIDVRGHVMVWPGTSNMPADIQAMLADGNLSVSEQQAVRNRITGHINSLGVATDGKLAFWDVVNETRANHDLMDNLSEGDAAMIDWFAEARAAVPDAKLYMNDYGILTSAGATNSSNQDIYFNTLEYLVNNGAEIDGIGFQSHFDAGSLTGPEQIWTILDRFATLGLDMQITEFDFGTDDKDLQAQFSADFMKAAFAHEGIDDFVFWGFWEDAHWRPNAAMFNSDWSINSNGQAYLDLVFDEWWTNEQAISGEDGKVTIRGFKGDYIVEVTRGGITQIYDAVLSGDGTQLLVTLPVLLGDYNADGTVDAGDYTVWRDTFGSTTDLAADGNRNGVVDNADYALWRGSYGASLPGGGQSVPEPTGAALLLAGIVALGLRRECRNQ